MTLLQYYCDSCDTIAIVVTLLQYYCDSCDTIAIVVTLLQYYCDSCDTIAIVVTLLRYYCDSCDTIEYIEFSVPQAFSGSMACILKHGGAYLTGNSCWRYLSF